MNTYLHAAFGSFVLTVWTSSFPKRRNREIKQRKKEKNRKNTEYVQLRLILLRAADQDRRVSPGGDIK
jgi:hypothetical protein